MRTLRQLRGLIVAALASLVLASAACSTTPPPVSVHNLERPSDIAFACVGLLPVLPGGGIAGPTDVSTPTVSGLPMDQCNLPGQFDPPFDATHRTFAFVANSARGELSVLDLDNSKLIDLDLGNPGTNVAPLGVLPEQMSASSDGCRIVTANRGSCDLTLVDIPTLMSPELALEGKVTVASATGPSTVAQEIVVRGGTTGKPLRLNPQEIMFLPQDTSAIFDRSKILGNSAVSATSVISTPNLCERGRPHADPIGWNSTPTVPVETQWKALVTYPTCNLVALVDLPSGNIVDSVKIVGSGVSIALAPQGADPDCPVEDFCDGRTPPRSPPPTAAQAAAPTVVPTAARATVRPRAAPRREPRCRPIPSSIRAARDRPHWRSCRRASGPTSGSRRLRSSLRSMSNPTIWRFRRLVAASSCTRARWG